MYICSKDADHAGVHQLGSLSVGRWSWKLCCTIN